MKIIIVWLKFTWVTFLIMISLIFSAIITIFIETKEIRDPKPIWNNLIGLSIGIALIVSLGFYSYKFIKEFYNDYKINKKMKKINN